MIGITFRQKISFRRLTGLSLNKLSLLFVVGVLGTGVSTYLSTYALTTTQLANIGFIEACLPLVVYFYSLVLLGERFNFPALWELA